MIAFPTFRINLKPLIPKGAQNIDARKVLQSVQREILKSVRSEIQLQAFSPRAKRALAAGMATRTGKNSVKIIAKHPAFGPLILGQKKEQMTWLTKATRPIPIMLDSGELIFRNASPHSMSRGRWYHPGRKPSTVLERARKSTRAILKKRLAQEMKRQLLSSLVSK